MNNETISQLIQESIADYLESRDGSRPRDLSPTTRLLGKDCVLDSIGLVSVLVDVEQRVSDATDRGICLMDDRAMSQSRSPFRSVQSLSEFIAALLAESLELICNAK